MFNMLSGEFYKLRKSRSFFVCSIVIIMFALFMYGTMYLAEKAQEEEARLEAESGEIVAFHVEESEDIEIGIVDMEQLIIGTVMGLITAVFTCIFIVGEYGNGTIKNAVGKGFSREKVFFAKYLTTVFAAVVIFVAATAVIVITGLWFWGTDSLDAEGVKQLLQYVGLQILLEIVLVSTVIMIAEFCRNLGAGIAISVGVMMLSNIIFSGIDTLLKLIHLDFKASDYWIMNLISECPTVGIESGFVKRIVVAFLFWMVVTIAAGMFHFRKADVK